MWQLFVHLHLFLLLHWQLLCDAEWNFFYDQFNNKMNKEAKVAMTVLSKEKTNFEVAFGDQGYASGGGITQLSPLK